MRRLLVALAALLLVLASAPLAALASDDADRAGTSSSGSGDSDDDSGDTPDDSDGRSDDDDDDDDDVADDDDDDDDGQHQRRNRNRNRGGDDEATPPAGGAGGGGGGARPAGPAPATVSVQVEDRSFAPAAVRVAVGGTVTWNNVSRDHTVTADDGSFDSGVFDAGASFDHTFQAAGTFDYTCLIHPEMTGTVTVGDASGGGGAGGPGGGSKGAASGSEGSASVGGSSSPGGSSSNAGARGSSGLPAIEGGAVRRPLTAAAAVESADVDVLDFEFAPSNVTVNTGATVRWTLRGTAPHTVTSDSFDSGMLRAGDVYEQTFNDVGEFAYRCDLHPEMTGTVTVAAADAADAALPTNDTGGAAADAGGGAGGADDARPAVSSGSGSLLANSGFRGVPAFAFALAVILLGWAALVTGRRRIGRTRSQV